jgi:hypothetical protein
VPVWFWPFCRRMRYREGVRVKEDRNYEHAAS